MADIGPFILQRVSPPVLRTLLFVTSPIHWLIHMTRRLTTSPSMLRLKDAYTLLDNEYLPVETGIGFTKDGHMHVCASTYMPGVTAAMIDWWFGWIHTTEQYKLWHPRDHVFSDWEGPRNNDSTYIGGHHLVHEYIGGTLQKLKISFVDPSFFFGKDWKVKFAEKGYGTAICGKVGNWDQEADRVVYIGKMVHLVKNEPDGCRMRSRFWLGDIESAPVPMGHVVPKQMTVGLMRHATEEMAILAAKVPELYKQHCQKS